MHETHITTLKGGAPVGTFRQTDYLQLADGKRVYHAEDMLRIVPEQSASAVAAREAESKESTADTLTAISWGLIVVGGVVMVVPFMSGPDEDGGYNMTPLYVGAGMMMVSLPLIFWGQSERQGAQDEKATAFETYEPALRDRLGLCREDDTVTPCP